MSGSETARMRRAFRFASLALTFNLAASFPSTFGGSPSPQADASKLSCYRDQQPQSSDTARIQALLAKQYEYKMISSGHNSPDVDLKRDHLGDICILLHARVAAPEIGRYFGWSNQELQKKLGILETEALIKRGPGAGYFPTLMVITGQDRARHLRIDSRLVEASVELIKSKLPEVKKSYEGLHPFSAIPFSHSSLFFLSNVLLDNWQIRNVESLYLHSPRTPRKGMNYYYSIQQKEKGTPTEAFDIYGNSVARYGELSVGLYGNARNGLNLVTMDKVQLVELFRMKESENLDTFKESLLRELLNVSQDSSYIPSSEHRSGFEKLGLLAGGKPVYPVLRETDDRQLSETARLITEPLIGLLRNHDGQLKAQYSASEYAREVTYQEYFMWWYHLYYSTVTDRLITEGLITKPEAGVFTYLISTEQ